MAVGAMTDAIMGTSGAGTSDAVSAEAREQAPAPPLDMETATLIRIAALVSVAGESDIRDGLRASVGLARDEWIEEVLLQSYLFAGFPRALNAMRLWRTVSGRPAPAAEADLREAPDATWTRGERTCALVYGPFYARLRHNIAALHPVLDDWMIGEGYGKVLGRPVLDLRRRELCVVASCIAAQQDRQLHSHLHGALQVGATRAEVASAIEVAILAVQSYLGPDAPRRYRQLWSKVSRH